MVDLNKNSRFTYLILELHVCQGYTLNITCPNNSVIVFDYANYGRGNSDYYRCSEFLGTESYACDSHERALQVLNEKCGESQRCVLLVTTNTFGNQCVGITKYLEVRYHCTRKRYHGMCSLLLHNKNAHLCCFCENE